MFSRLLFASFLASISTVYLDQQPKEILTTPQVSHSQIQTLIKELSGGPSGKPPRHERGVRRSLGPNSCRTNPDELPMIGIRPEEVENGITARNTPTLVFYASSSIIPNSESSFVLQTTGTSIFDIEKEYESLPFSLSSVSGIITLTIPPPNPNDTNSSYLELDQYYEWYFTVKCTTVNGDERKETLSGTIRRVTAGTTEQNARIYYDEIADAVLTQSEENVSEPWQEILQTIALEEYKGASLVDKISLPPAVTENTP